MSLGISLVILIVLAGVGMLGGHLGDAGVWIFGIGLPYVAVAVFLGGFCYRVLMWAKVPVPFRITTTTGQQKSLDFIKSDPVEAPHDTKWVLGRMLLEVLLFRSLLRNTRMEVQETEDGAKVVYNSNLWLWGFGLAFHWCFLFIVIRHMRFFTEPVPFFIQWAEFLDTMVQIGVPILYMTDLGLLAGISYLFFRRLITSQVRYISLPQDYFPLLLIGAIGITGAMMRYLPWTRVDVHGVKELGVSLASFDFAIPAEPIGAIFFVHLFLVCSLLLYFPFSKLMHMGGIFFSPTRNMANNNREQRYVSPIELDAHPHTYAEYEDEFRDKMAKCGLPLDKPLAEEEAKDV